MSYMLRSVITAVSESASLLQETLYFRGNSNNVGKHFRTKTSDGSMYLSKLPVEIIYIIIHYLSESHSYNGYLRDLLLLNKRYDL